MNKAIYIKILIIISALLVSGTLYGDDSEYKLKSAYIYKIAKFVTWPTETLQRENSPIKIAFLGEDTMGKYLNALRNKMIDEHPIEVKSVSDVRECVDCHIIFISKEYKSNMKAIRLALKELPILTISDMDEFIELGGLVSLDTVKNRLIISIDNSTAKSVGLNFNSKLLRVARILKIRL